MYAAALVFADHPIVGVGPDMFHSYYADYVQLAGDNSYFAGTRQAHNLYLSIAANHGLLGLIAYLVIIYFTLRWLAQARKQLAVHDPMLANIATGLILAITSYLATGIGLHFGFARFYWLIMALACATVQIAQVKIKALQTQAQ
jgi:O-antigen ligase